MRLALTCPFSTKKSIVMNDDNKIFADTDKALAQTGPVRVIVESVSPYALQYAGPLASRP
jgi:hypothetical protein